MFRLKATIVATTLMRPWRNGWRLERGVDFSLAPAPEPVTAPPVARANLAPVEPPSFIDEDGGMPTCGAEANGDGGPSASGAGSESASGDAPEVSGLRAWWALTSKLSRT